MASKIGTEFFVPNDDVPYGLSYGQWTIRWWEWCFSAPLSQCPLTDTSGRYSHLNQSGPVWFLCGTFGEDICPKRECTIPQGKGILFPIINYIYVSDSKFSTDLQVTERVRKDINDIINLEAILDGRVITSFRVKSEPKIFQINIANENKLGLPVGGNRAASDGFWIFLKPLAQGEHHLYFHGSCSGGIKTCSASYQLFLS